MTVGLQIFLDDGSTQLTNDDVYFSLVQHGVLAASLSFAQEGGNAGFYDLTLSNVSLVDSPMLALRSTVGTWCQIVATTSNSVTWRIFRSGYAAIYFYLYMASPPPPGHLGLELYDSAGNVLMTTEYPPVRPLGMFTQNGYSGLSLDSKTLAHVPMKMAATAYRYFSHGSLGSCMQGGAYPGYQTYQTEGWQRAAIAINGSTVTIKPREQHLGPYPYACMIQPPSTAMNNFQSLDYSTLIIDVSNI